MRHRWLGVGLAVAVLMAATSPAQEKAAGKGKKPAGPPD